MPPDTPLSLYEFFVDDPLPSYSLRIMTVTCTANRVLLTTPIPRKEPYHPLIMLIQAPFFNSKIIWLPLISFFFKFWQTIQMNSQKCLGLVIPWPQPFFIPFQDQWPWKRSKIIKDENKIGAISTYQGMTARRYMAQLIAWHWFVLFLWNRISWKQRQLRGWLLLHGRDQLYDNIR